MIFLAIIEYAFLASTFTIAKVAIRYADPLFLIGMRMVCAAPIMFFIHYLQQKNSFRIHRRDATKFLKVSVFHIFVPFVAEFWALQYVSSAKTAITYSLTPFIAALLSYILLRKKLTAKQTLGLIIGLLGLMPILVSRDEVALSGGLFFVSVPEIVLLIAVTSASYAWFIVADLMKRGYGISLINGVAMLFGGMFAFILWYFVSGDQSPITGTMQEFLLWTAALIVVANVISYNLYGWLLRHLSINFMSAIGFLCPIFASIYGFVLLNEDIGIYHVTALVMVCFGLWLFYRDEMRKPITS